MIYLDEKKKKERKKIRFVYKRISMFYIYIYIVEKYETVIKLVV